MTSPDRKQRAKMRRLALKHATRSSSARMLRKLHQLFSWMRLIFTPLLLITPGIIIGVFLYIYIFRDFPSPARLASQEIPQTTKIFSRNGELLYDIFVDTNRTLVPLTEIPGHLKEATIAIEDKDFYKHWGINPVGGVIRAIRENILHHDLQGGSTITQQLVKTALLTPERTIQRKVKEVILAVMVESRYTKDKILELYLNYVPYGGTAWGIEAASQMYFGKHVKDLNLAESALLAGLPAAPTLYSPYGAHPELSKQRQELVLGRMVEDGYITQDEAEKALKKEVHFLPTATNITAPHFVMYVKEQLVKKYGEKMVAQGGLRVTTTLDLSLQEFTQSTVASEVAKLTDLNVGNGAALVTRPATGEILAMVGSTDYFASPSGNFNVATALRQPGSAIKPINYAIGLENRTVTPATVLNDIPTCFPSIPAPYCPKNYDGRFHGPVQIRFALGNSYNIPAVKMLKLNTVAAVVASASAFGITSFTDPERYGLSLTLGGAEVAMVDMATGFGVFANGGIRKDLVAILKVEDADGNVLDKYHDANLNKNIPSSLLINGPQIVSPETAFLISHILLDQNARVAAFGSSYLQVDGHPSVSVKTGTTDDKRDNWTIGFTPEILVATWVGNNDNSPMHPYLTSGITGAAPIWNKIMSFVLKGKKESWPRQPDGIVGAQICSISGLLAPEDNSCSTRFEYFIKGTQPKEREQLKISVPIDTTTGKLASPNQSDNVEVQEHLMVRDPFGVYCVDCAQEENPPKITE